MFSQELLTNGELNHFSLKERMVEIGKRWHKLSAAQKDKYKKLVEEQQVEYKVELEAWLKVRPPPTPGHTWVGLSQQRRSSGARKTPRQPSPWQQLTPPRNVNEVESLRGTTVSTETVVRATDTRESS